MNPWKFLALLFSYICTLMFLIAIANAEDHTRGVSWILQMCTEKTDCTTIRDSYQGASRINTGWMYLTSNPNRCKCSQSLLRDPRPKRVRVHICNSTCFPERGRRCEKHECFAGMTAKTASAAILKNDRETYLRIDKSIAMLREDLKAAVQPLSLGIAPCLECTLTREARVKLNEYVKSKTGDIPNVRYVDNPYGDSCLPGYLCEKHGTPDGNGAIISDNDGLDYDTINQWGYWKKNADAWLALAWKICNNGLKKSEPYRNPVDRINYCGMSRDGTDFKSFTVDNAVTVTREVSQVDLKGCKNKNPDTKGLVLKLGDGRAYGVFLAPASLSRGVFKKVELRANGKVDGASQQPGYRYGQPYEHDPAGKKRRIYDLRKHPNTYPDNSVLFADGNCWILKKPRFRVAY